MGEIINVKRIKNGITDKDHKVNLTEYKSITAMYKSENIASSKIVKAVPVKKFLIFEGKPVHC